MIVVSGSCQDFNQERQRIMEFIGTLEWSTHTQSQCECSSIGKSMGWEFFQIYFDPNFIENLVDVYPDIQKQEGNAIEERFVIWLNKQLKKIKLEYYLKLREVPHEPTKGFRLDPEAYRDDNELEKLR